MTSALQLTDTDFAMSFKAAVRRCIDEILMPQAGEPMQKLGIREMATALHKAMEYMVKKTGCLLACEEMVFGCPTR